MRAARAGGGGAMGLPNLSALTLRTDSAKEGRDKVVLARDRARRTPTRTRLFDPDAEPPLFDGEDVLGPGELAAPAGRPS